MPLIRVDKVVHYYSIEGADGAPALVFANSLINTAAHISCVEQPEIFAGLLLNFVEGIGSV
jgi:hypothetical protein